MQFDLKALLPEGVDPAQLDGINLSGKELSAVDDISHLKDLHKLNLSDNCFSTADALDGLARNSELSFLNLAKNKLQSAEFVSGLQKLTGNLFFRI